jgi:hypothetical protein
MMTTAVAAGRPWMNIAARLVTIHALDHVGRCLTRTLPRSARHRDAPVRRLHTWERHIAIPASGVDLDRVLRDAFVTIDVAAPDATAVRAPVESYVRNVVSSGRFYRDDELDAVLDAYGCHGT